MNTSTFSPKIYAQTEKSAKALSVSTGLMQLKNIAGDLFKTYVLDHEASALILLALSLIIGTVYYVDFQPRLDATADPLQSSAFVKSAEAQIQQRLIAGLSAQITTVAAAEITSAGSNLTSNSSNLADQSTGLLPASKRENQLVHRKGVHHHHHHRR